MKIELKSLYNANGFSLVELLVSVAILGYALSAVLISYINNSHLTQTGRNLTKAITHEEYVMEDIRNTAFANIATKINNGDWNWDSTAVTANGLNALKNESITTTVSGTNPLDVTVTVSWTDASQRSQTKGIRTLIAG